MRGHCYLFGCVCMSRGAFEELLRDAETDGFHWISDAVLCDSLYFDDEDSAAVVDGMYVSWDSDWVVALFARHKDQTNIDTLEWSGEGADGPLSDVLFYFLGPGRWKVKEPRRPRLGPQERKWLLRDGTHHTATLRRGD